ncbi:hypothetical protein WDW86_08330 [Bdellovibrionota bacterium FG-2]
MAYPLLVFFALVLAFFPYPQSDSYAAGKKKPTPESCNTNPGPTTPTPTRRAILLPFQTKAFQLPNGSQVNLSADLDTVFSTAVTVGQAFSPTDPSDNDACDMHIELRAAISTLELNAFEAGVTFGYAPAGASNPVSNITGKTTVKVGTIAMDFSVRQCVGSRCSAIAAVSANHLTAGVDVKFDIDFNEVKTSTNLIYNTPLGGILRKIMNDGVKRLSADPAVANLNWKATVKESVPEAGMFIFDAGTQSRIFPNQSFVVYAVTPATGICSLFHVVGYAHTTQVDPVSSVAFVDQILDPRGVQPGDIVMVRVVSSQ